MSNPKSAPAVDADAPSATEASSASPAAGESGDKAQNRVTAGRAGKMSREFIGIVAFVVLAAVGALGFRGWQQAQKAPDLNFAMDFIKENLESPTPPHLARAALNGQVAAFYKENGPVIGVVSHDIDSRQKDPFGDPVCLTNTMVSTKNGPVLIHVKVQMRDGKRSILSFVYEPQQ